MAIHLQGGKDNFEPNLESSKIHSVPFKVYADCDALVSSYFEKNVRSDKDDLLKTSFRGYPLNGKKIDVPEGYVGLVLHESMKPCTDQDERKVYITNKFKEITFWNWDKIPSRNDPFLKALDWIDIAEVLHSPILPE